MRTVVAYLIFYTIAIVLVLNLFGMNEPDQECTKEDYHDTH